MALMAAEQARDMVAREQETARRRELEQAHVLAEEQGRRAEAENQRVVEQGRTSARLRRLALVLLALLAITLGMVGFALTQRQRALASAAIARSAQAGTAVAEGRRAEQQRGIANSRAVAAQALNHKGDQFDLALLLRG